MEKKAAGWNSFETLETTTQWLWQVCMAAVLDRLEVDEVNQVVLIPTGLLSLLPLQAAWTLDPSRLTNRRYAFDQIRITYAPTPMH